MVGRGLGGRGAYRVIPSGREPVSPRCSRCDRSPEVRFAVDSYRIEPKGDADAGDAGGGGSAARGARATVRTECEVEHGWEFTIGVRAGPGPAETEHTVTLAYRDHDAWTGGKMSPSQLIVHIIDYTLRHRPEPLPPKFDAARVRYWFPRFDEEMRGGW